MTLRDVYTCWGTRRENPIYTARIPPRVRVGQALFIVILVGMSAVYFSLFGFGDEEAFGFIAMLALAWPFLCAMYFFFFSGRSFRDEFLQDIHLTALSRQEVLFGASFPTLRVLLVIPLLALLVTVPMFDWQSMREEIFVASAFFVAAWTVMAASGIVVWRVWVSQPGRILAVLLVSYIRCGLGFAAGGVMIVASVLAIETGGSSSWQSYEKTLLLFLGITGVCVFILFHRLRDSLAVAEHALFRRVTPDHWPDVVWYANEKRPARFSPEDRAFIWRAFLQGGWAAVMVFGGLLAVSVPMLLTSPRTKTVSYDFSPAGPSYTNDYSTWDPILAFFNGISSVQSTLVLAIITAILMTHRMRKGRTEGLLPTLPNWRRGTLAVYTGAVLLPVAVHMAICLGLRIGRGGWSLAQLFSLWLFLLFLAALLLNTINASLLSGVHRRRRAILWMLFATASWGLSFTDEGLYQRGSLYLGSNNERYYLGLILALSIAAHGLVSWVPRLMQEWWLAERAVEQEPGETGQSLETLDDHETDLHTT